MKPVDKNDSTSQEIERYQQNKNIKRTSSFIMARIKYLRDLDSYDILTKKQLFILLDQLSLNAQGLNCKPELKEEIYAQCPKQVRDTVKIGDLAITVAKKLFEETTEQQLKDDLNSVFIQAQPKNLPNKKWYQRKFLLFRCLLGMGIGCLVSPQLVQSPENKSDLISRGLQCNIPQQSSGRLDINKILVPALFTDMFNFFVYRVFTKPCQQKFQVVTQETRNFQAQIEANLIDNSSSTVIEQGLKKNYSYLRILATYLERGYTKFRYFIVGTFFNLNQVTKSLEFSKARTLDTVLYFLPIAILIGLFLVRNKEKPRNPRDQIFAENKKQSP